MRPRNTLLMFLAIATGRMVSAQGTPAPTYEDADQPSIKVGTVIFADYTYMERPRVTDAAGNEIHQNSFNITRGYINVTGNLSSLIAFRITPDIKADTNSSDPSLNGSEVFRIKYAYGQLNLDRWLGKEAWLRLGAIDTPFIGYEERAYRYRFQGPVFVDREGFLTSADYGLAGHANFPGDYGDVHVGVYNGEGYSSLADANGANDQKAFQIRAALRPAPGVNVLKGLRFAAFWDGDNFVKDAKKQRFILNAIFEHPYLNVGFDWVEAKNQTLPTASTLDTEAWSVWATPRTSFGLEALFRYDDVKPDKHVDVHRNRLIAGIAYWFPLVKGVSSALLADFEQVRSDHALGKPTERRYALHTLFSY